MFNIQKYLNRSKEFIENTREYQKDPVMKDESGEGVITEGTPAEPEPELEPTQAIQPEPLLGKESIYQGEPQLPDEWQGTNEERKQRERKQRQNTMAQGSAYGGQKHMNLTGSQGSSILTS